MYLTIKIIRYDSAFGLVAVIYGHSVVGADIFVSKTGGRAYINKKRFVYGNGGSHAVFRVEM